jgi:hypothetical protein
MTLSFLPPSLAFALVVICQSPADCQVAPSNLTSGHVSGIPQQMSPQEIAEEIRIHTQLELQSRQIAKAGLDHAFSVVPTSYLTVVPHLHSVAAYDQLYGQIIKLQAESLAHTFAPSYADSMAMQASVFGALGNTFTALQDWVTCSLPNPQGEAVYTTSELTTGPVSNLVLLPFGFPQLNFSADPAWMAQVFGPVNTNPVPGYFYSATFNGTIHHSGIAALSMQNGVQVLSLLPDMVDGAGMLIPAYLVPQLRWLHHAAGAVSDPDLFAAIKPAYLPPTWVAHDDDLRAFQLQVDCDKISIEVEKAMEEFNKCMADAEKRYHDRIKAAKDTLKHQMNSLGAEFFSLRAMAAILGPGILGFLSPAQQIDFEAKSQFYQAFLTQYDTAIQNAETGLVNDRCACFNKLHNKLQELIANCEPWNILSGEITIWLYQWCPFPLPG